MSFVIRHLSDQMEAGMGRRVECEVNAIVMGELAKEYQGLKAGAVIKTAGFLARRSFKSTQLVLHINRLEQLS